MEVKLLQVLPDRSTQQHSAEVKLLNRKEAKKTCAQQKATQDRVGNKGLKHGARGPQTQTSGVRQAEKGRSFMVPAEVKECLVQLRDVSEIVGRMQAAIASRARPSKYSERRLYKHIAGRTPSATV